MGHLNKKYLLRLQGIKARYPFSKKEVLQGINMEIKQGDFVAILGPNGAGKSTLFKVIYGILPRLAGKIFLMGREIKNPSPIFWIKEGVHYLPQGSQLFPNLSIRDNFYLAYRFLTKRQIRREIGKFFFLLKTIPSGEKISENFDKRAGLLSGGERQILSLGMTLMGEPKLLLLDEPTAGLTLGVSEKLFSWLKKKNAEENLTIVVVEHNLKNVLQFSSRIFNMMYGKILEMRREDFSDIKLLRSKILGKSEG